MPLYLSEPPSRKNHKPPTVAGRFLVTTNTIPKLLIYRILVLGFIGIISLSFYQCSHTDLSTEQFVGTKLTGKFGRDFELIDQNGKSISNSTHGDQTAILTFLFSACTDVCPIVTSQIKATISDSKELQNIPVMIITVDPDRDDQQTRLRFTNKWNLPSNWHFLSGEPDLLKEIWNSYHLNPQISQTQQQRLQHSLETKYKIVHTTPIYLLDGKGRPKVLHSSPINSENLRSDLHILIGK